MDVPPDPHDGRSRAAAPVRWEGRRTRATLAGAFTLSGVGLHGGGSHTVRVAPAETGSGVTFRCAHGRGPAASARVAPETYVLQTLCSGLRLSDGAILRTVEHLLASLAAFGIDDAGVEVAGLELPIFDGSAVAWVDALRDVGRRDLRVPTRALRVLRPVVYEHGRARLRITPAPALSLDVRITLKHFGPIRWSGGADAATFASELAPARSFGRLQWALPAKIAGIFARPPILRGASASNTAVLWGKGIWGGMRLPDEPVRHRALDLIGDLAFAGMPILGHVVARDPGHTHNHGLLAKLLADRRAYEIVDG